MPDAPIAPATPAKPEPTRSGWLFPALRVAFVLAAALLVWFIAANWNRWTGAARFQTTDDAYVAADVTPLAAKVSGYIESVAVADNEVIRKGDLIATIEPSDYKAQLLLAEANLAAAQASLTNLANQKDVQRALIRQAEASVLATRADLQRYTLEVKRQADLLVKQAGTSQLVEQSDANEKRAQAQLQLNEAQIDQQRAILASLDVQGLQLAAQVRGAEAQATLARNNLGYTQIMAPADGMVGQRQVRPGQFVNVGTQVIAVVPLPNVWVVANYKETQLANMRLRDPVRVTVDAYPDLVLTGVIESWSPGTGSTFALLPPDNATGNFTKVVQRVPVKIVLDPNPALGTLVRPGMSVVATIETAEKAAAPEPASTELPAPPRTNNRAR
jgi:membrane fusion protein (multidrug efflux system)